jgi:DNA-binding beta-propeller fold protein YncE
MSTLLAVIVACVLGRAEPPLVVEKEIPLPGVKGRIDHMAADALAHRVYVAAIGNGSVEVVDVAASKRLGSITGLTEPQGVQVDPSRHRLYVTCGGDGTVRAFDTESLNETGHVTVGPDADNLRFDAAKGELVVGYGEGALAILNAADLRVKQEIKLSGHPESFQLAPDGTHVLVNVPGGPIGGGGSVLVVDRDKSVVQSTWKLSEAGRNFPMAVNHEGTRAYLGCRRGSYVLVLDSKDGRVFQKVECAGDADDVFVDEARKRVYVSGGDGQLDAFKMRDDGSLERQSVESPSGARTSVLVPEWSELLLAAPARGGKDARIVVYRLEAEQDKGTKHEVDHP